LEFERETYQERINIMNSIGGACLALLTLTAGLLVFCGTTLGDVVINEVEISPSDNGSMWVELYNTGDQAVDIGNWKIAIIATPWVGPINVPNGTEILPKMFYVAEGDPKWVAVNNASVLLKDSHGKKVNETPLLTDPGHNDFTQSRIEDGRNTDTRSDWAWMRASKGRSNTGSKIA
jgi:hypothetical protein